MANIRYHDRVMIHGHTPPHVVNIAIHVLAGVAAIVSGLVAIASRKGGRVHVKSGRLFIYAYIVLVITAILGVAVFEFRSFLAIATIASSYDVFAGYRALRLRGRRPQFMDRAASLLALLAPAAFVFAIRALHKPWSPALTWSVLGGLIGLALYDLFRIVLPISWLRRVWLQEHLYKMMAAFIAATATGAATILPQWAPWSALVPVIAGEGLTVYFLFAYRRPRAQTCPAASPIPDHAASE
jgi:uncharacterized membrane protein